MAEEVRQRDALRQQAVQTNQEHLASQATLAAHSQTLEQFVDHVQKRFVHIEEEGLRSSAGLKKESKRVDAQTRQLRALGVARNRLDIKVC